MIPALSIRQPWAWLIVHGFKDIENRDWPTNFRGRYYAETCEELLRMGLLPADMPAYEDLPRGGFVGWTHVTDCRQHHPSPWKQDGSHGFVLRDSSPIPFVPWKGRLGFFNVPKEAVPS